MATTETARADGPRESGGAAPGAAVAPDDGRAAATVFYDGGCPVCRREIGWYRAMRGADGIRWVDIASEEPPEGFARDELLRRFTILRRDGAATSGARAFVALWRALGPTRLLGRALDRAPFLQMGELAYRAFLRLRTGWR
jgi:predicted DCC family thiol-disulfide oxidoreductase YuxK